MRPSTDGVSWYARQYDTGSIELTRGCDPDEDESAVKAEQHEKGREKTKEGRKEGDEERLDSTTVQTNGGL